MIFSFFLRNHGFIIVVNVLKLNFSCRIYRLLIKVLILSINTGCPIDTNGETLNLQFITSVTPFWIWEVKPVAVVNHIKVFKYFIDCIYVLADLHSVGYLWGILCRLYKYIYICFCLGSVTIFPCRLVITTRSSRGLWTCLWSGANLTTGTASTTTLQNSLLLMSFWCSATVQSSIM